ncbi:MAG: PAS domain-containing sensor histidine kinase [Alphaproteobacteria bacterium]|nr:PAS domain-containing sensor histidine kinase [Alphaproteobacteria bacterium]MBV9016901.1 PAS domain-containing sensor histidine kinase [Alphaproteobacteria bacterium]MBV9150826.1 PAS domain-containing sensor histidine kinase [Alphaproteobacteria bacterium]
MSLAGQLRGWTGGIGVWRKLAIALASAALASGLATYLALTGAPPFGPRPTLVLSLLNLDLVLLLALAAVVAKRLFEVRAERRRNLAGSRLQVRLVGLFSLIAVLPTIIVAVFSYLFFSFGVESWFSDKVRTAISESVAVADAYVREHQQAIRADALAMAADLDRSAGTLQLNPQYLAPVLTAQAAMRGLTEAAVVDRRGTMLARTGLAFALGFEDVSQDALRRANQGEVVIMTNDQDERVRALVRLGEFSDLYLYVGRFIEPRVLAHRDEVHLAAAQYERLEGQRSGFQITFAVIYILVALLFLAAAISIGIHFAAQLGDPISRLMGAAERIRAGDLAARVPEGEKDDELVSLSRAFNRMTYQIQSQQRELIEANRQLDDRRRFTETVLTGVSAGVIGLDRDGRINLPNRSASALLGTDLDLSIGEHLAEVVPEMADLLGEAARRPDRRAQGQLQLARNNSTRTLLVRIAAEQDETGISGFVVTFDDITELLSAQRKAAWADIARRIAHEIKNPLTPIQLSAERLRRKYSREIKKDADTFRICTDTIIRHVEDIGRLVDEFSSFARMPTPVLKPEDLTMIVEQAVFLQRTAHPDIAFETHLASRPIPLRCDARLVSQALINILKNAIESIEGRIVEGRPTPSGWVEVSVGEAGGRVSVIVEDNGKGLPQQHRERLTEPYVTTRSKGTGLGLAIVKKIMEDHQGELLLEDREAGGARVTLVFAGEPHPAVRSYAAEPAAELSPVSHGA